MNGIYLRCMTHFGLGMKRGLIATEEADAPIVFGQIVLTNVDSIVNIY